LNTGSSDEWEKVAQEHFSPAELERHSVEARKQVFDNVRRDFGTISLRQVEGPDQPLRLHNAARYTLSEGVITVSAFHRDKETVVEAHNTSSTLTPDEIARVFDRLYRADPSRQRASGGTGLGLSIVKNPIEAQGGRVSSRSDDSGVSFVLALPSHT
jgi:two-component system, OmpR family, sensor histidine kinase BaeS